MSQSAIMEIAMEKKNKIRTYNRLFIKLYLNYAVMLLVTAVLICLIFMKLYENNTMERHQLQLESQALSISAKMSEFIKYGNYKSGEFYEYYIILEGIYNLDPWTISNPYADMPMDERLETNSYEDVVGTEYEELVNSAFQNKKKYRISYEDSIYGIPMITMAVPISGINREVVGVVLLFSKVEGQKDIISSSLYLVARSSFVALAISFIIIILFAKELSVPISRMRFTSLELAAGNYQIKTGIERKDEIGDLANTIDVLSEKLLENDIQRKNLDQMRLDFFANVSHELRTPITVIRAYTETLFDGVVKDEAKVSQYYGRMLSECKSMERLVGDLLILSKMQNPDFIIEKEPVNLNQVFDDIIRSAIVIAEKKNIKIDIIKDETVCMMLGDYDRLRQMFLIILDNAIKFSEENKTVHIKISKQDKIKVSIQDEGIGIDTQDIDNIFEKFYKSNLRQNASGTGLGLAIAKQISLKHGGDIEVTSSIGEGTEFVFIFDPYEMEC